MTSDSTGIVRQHFAVPYAYTVAFTRDVFAPQNPVLVESLTHREPGRRHRVQVILDEGVTQAFPHLADQVASYFHRHAEALALVGPPLVVPGGEIAKNDSRILARILDTLAAGHLDRQSFVLMLGGGAVLDVAGYAAAIAHRGLRTVRLPSTVLGQNDAGVGVKNGVNGYGAKNFLGTFHPPFAVINDFALLEGLPARDRIAGYAEAVKVALVKDASFFAWLEAHASRLAQGDRAAVATLVRRAAELHLAHIAQGGDPFEQGSARPLDYGHWAAHHLETCTEHALRHGEAVALGILLDTRYAVLMGRLPPHAFSRVYALLETLGLPCWHEALARPAPTAGPSSSPPASPLALWAGLESFREHLGGDLCVTLLRDIGHAEEVHHMDAVGVTEAVCDLERLASSPPLTAAPDRQALRAAPPDHDRLDPTQLLSRSSAG